MLGPGFVGLHRQLVDGWDSALLVIRSAEAHGAESISLWKTPDYHWVGGDTTTCSDTQVSRCGWAVPRPCRQLKLILSLLSNPICPWEVKMVINWKNPTNWRWWNSIQAEIITFSFEEILENNSVSFLQVVRISLWRASLWTRWYPFWSGVLNRMARNGSTDRPCISCVRSSARSWPQMCSVSSPRINCL